jgi:rhamnosyltransferase
MRIKIIIPILNPPQNFFEQIIPMLLSQNIQPGILLINSGSDIPNGDYDLIEIDKKDFNHANTRNHVLEYTSDFYLFMTQDAQPYDETLIENLIKMFEDADVVVAYAHQIPYPDADPIEIFARTTGTNKNLYQSGHRFFNKA